MISNLARGRSAIALPVVVCCCLFAACGSGERGAHTMQPEEQALSDEAWAAFAGHTVAFGRQSVGGNIVRGLQELATEAGHHLDLAETRQIAAGAGLRHFPVGRNGDPLGKIADFAALLRSGDSESVTVALLKLCYVDFPPEVDPAHVARTYCATLDELQEEFSRTTFLAVTAPLTTVQSGPKAWAKRLLGRSPSGLADNARRQVFNEHLRAYFGPQGRLFDLAALEAAGVRQPVHEGRPVEVLNPGLTDDGGHLNRRGARLAAAVLVGLVASLPAAERAD